MTDITLNSSIGDAAPVQPASRPNLDKGFNPLTMILFFGILAAGLLYVAYSIYADIDATGMRVTAFLPYILLFVALLIALGFEFVNGFHDTANAVATVIYTHSLPAEFAVMWSGFFNFLGVLLSSGAVAFGIVSLLPVELILQVGSSAGFAMVFALLIAAIIWNLGTWYFGLPASSSHTLIGSIIGVGIANALMRGRDGTSGVDWTKATEIGYALLLSPLFGFCMAAILLLVLKFIVRNPALYAAPEGNKPPPLWIRGILIATCTGVSFAHGSNDGQKGMGLIMLILIGTVPTAYALNRALPESQVAQFQKTSEAASKVVAAKGAGHSIIGDPRPAVTQYVATRQISEGTYPSLAVLVKDVGEQVQKYGSLNKVPAEAVGNTRNDMYLTSEAIRFLMKDKENDLKQGRGRHPQGLQGLARLSHQVHPALGQDRGGDRARAGHHDRLEAHRRHRRREDRQDASDLRARRVRRTGCRRHDRRRRRVRPAGFHHACAVIRRRRHHGSQRFRPADGDHPQSADGMGADAAGRDLPVGKPLRAVLEPVLTTTNPLRTEVFDAGSTARRAFSTPGRRGVADPGPRLGVSHPFGRRSGNARRRPADSVFP